MDGWDLRICPLKAEAASYMLGDCYTQCSSCSLLGADTAIKESPFVCIYSVIHWLVHVIHFCICFSLPCLTPLYLSLHSLYMSLFFFFFFFFFFFSLGRAERVHTYVHCNSFDSSWWMYHTSVWVQPTCYDGLQIMITARKESDETKSFRCFEPKGFLTKGLAYIQKVAHHVLWNICQLINHHVQNGFFPCSKAWLPSL